MGERVALPPYFQYVGVQCVGPMAGAGGRSRGPRSYLQITVDLPVSYFPRGLEAVAGLRVGGCSSYSRPTRPFVEGPNQFLIPSAGLEESSARSSRLARSSMGSVRDTRASYLKSLKREGQRKKWQGERERERERKGPPYLASLPRCC
jgi:hypothetical protein